MHRTIDNKIYYLHVDYQNNLLAISNEAEQLLERISGVYIEQGRSDAWGRPRKNIDLEYNLPNPFGGSSSSFTMRGYTFHEHLEMVGLINMNGRVYDPILGRMLSPDNLVPDAANTQGYNRYSYCYNNPLKYTDPDGNEPITISAIVIGMAYGAIIGAGTSAAVYTSSSLAMGNFNVNDLGKASLMGAIGGAVGGGLGAGFAGSAFGQSIGFGVLKTTTANVAGNLALGNKMTVGSLVGSIAGGILYGSIPGFTGVAGGSLKNGMMEMIHNTSISGVTGGVSGIIGAGIDGKDMAAAYDAGIVAGALGGAVSSGLMVSIFGSAVIPSDNVRDVVKKYNSQSNNNSIYAPVFRRGGLYGLFSSRGVTWGRNLVVPQNDQDTYTHEYIHYLQAIKQGFGNMQMKGIYEQTKYIINGENWNPYYTKGTNEYYAEHPKEFFRLYKH